ncbi:MAG: hypothetical protein KKF12_03800 [Proteobacteria bacterium]|nr:hypothetical protein [Pseudomonadota bacterium]MBU4129923.1 hypothetical protein [Pseudomonadota bacterium]
METSLATSLTWLGIVFCLSQSAMFSGMNRVVFSMSRLRRGISKKEGPII